jgi:hypothetical protein
MYSYIHTSVWRGQDLPTTNFHSSKLYFLICFSYQPNEFWFVWVIHNMRSYDLQFVYSILAYNHTVSHTSNSFMYTIKRYKSTPNWHVMIQPVLNMRASFFSSSSFLCCAIITFLSSKNCAYSIGSRCLTTSIPQERAVPIIILQIISKGVHSKGGSSALIFAISYMCFRVIFPATSGPEILATRTKNALKNQLRRYTLDYCMTQENFESLVEHTTAEHQVVMSWVTVCQ